MSIDLENQRSSTTVFPVAMYKVSREWILSVFNETKKVVMNKAIESDCSKEFLASLNSLEFTFTDDACIKVGFPSEEPMPAVSVTMDPSQSTLVTAEPATEQKAVEAAPKPAENKAPEAAPVPAQPAA